MADVVLLRGRFWIRDSNVVWTQQNGDYVLGMEWLGVDLLGVFAAVFGSAGICIGVTLEGNFFFTVFWDWGKRKAGRLEPPRLGVSVDLGDLGLGLWGLGL